MEQKAKDYYTIDLLHIVKVLRNRLWVVVLVGILAAAIGFSMAAFVIAPQYSSSILLYVNNSAINLGNTSFNISASDITASQSLVKTYSVILKNRTTMERVIEQTGVNYSPDQLMEMIEATSANGTQIMQVTVTSTDPYEAAKLANCIAEVLPARITGIIDGATMEVVDSAVPDTQKISPSITRYTAIALILGALVAVIAIALVAVLDNTIHDEEYILQTYQYPILAKVPNLLDTDGSGYGYYKKTGPGSGEAEME